MTDPNSPGKRAFFVDAISEKETFEAPIDRYYHGAAPQHRAKDAGIYDVDRLVAECSNSLVRSAQEFLVSASGLGRKLFWTNLIFDRGEGTFWQVTVKSNTYSSGNAFEGTYTVNVTAPTPDRAATDIRFLQEHYGKAPKEEGPAFYMLRDTRGQPVRVALDSEREMSASDLELHYGEGFADWAELFIDGLAEPGLSILRGKPGTGKTTFLRHAIAKLWETHRFYYVPVESFGLLSSARLPEVWSKEQRSYPNAVKIIVLEDAEQLLLERSGERATEVSSLLNLTDGFIGDLVHVHLICTINCEIESLDEAILRPGRQKAFREFELLPYGRAEKLATLLGVTLKEKRDYTLAELYHAKDISRKEGDLLTKKKPKPIGFR